MLNEIRQFLATITDWVVLLVVFTFFFFTCNVETVNVFGRTTTLPVPSEPSFVAEFFTMLVRDVAPSGIPMVVTAPTTAFVIQVKLAFLLAIFFTFPVFLFRLISFLAPALRRFELRIIYTLLAPLTLLFFAGVYFAYNYIVPATLKVLYGFTGPIAVTPLLGVSEFMGVTIALLFATGTAFTLPVFMVLLTAMGAVPGVFWLDNTRYALVFMLILSAIITPDGSGVSMLLLSVPVGTLYGIGALVALKLEGVGERRYPLGQPTRG